MVDPLNPSLYRRLSERLGEVIIHAEGDAFECTYTRDATALRGDSPWKLEVLVWGETYRVNCPFCNDTRNRLYINHRWAVVDAKTGKRNLWLATCYNEGCLSDHSRRVYLWEKLYSGFVPKAGVTRIKQGRKSTGKVREVLPPGRTISVADLPPSHPAYQYLEGRGFDPAAMAKLYDVSYCDYSSRYPLAANRLIIPCYENDKMVGWQARILAGTPSKRSPKYWSAPGMLKSKLVYNLQNAKNEDMVVICEGPTDVWSFGPEAVALFGKVCSPSQRKKLIKTCEGKRVVVMLDPDQWKETEEKGKKHPITKLYEQLQKTSLRKDLLMVVLPEGTDPGQLDRAFMLKAISRAKKLQRSAR